MHTPDRYTRSLLLAGAVLAGASAVAGAAQAAPTASMVAAKFQLADIDGNGKLTRDEAKANMPRVAKAFDQLDAAKRGYLTLDQVQAFAASR